MVRKFFKNIPVFFLCLSGLITSGHLIIPHDHHLSESVTSHGDSCPISNNRSGHHTGFPVHCQALNDLTLVKASSNFFSVNIRFNNLALGSFFDPFAYTSKFLFITIKGNREFFPDSYLREYSSLRAPPSLI